MKTKTILTLLGLAGATSLFAQQVQLNEVRIDQPSDDVNEYIELSGTPGTSLDNLWVLSIGDHSGEGQFLGSGTVEFAVNLTGFTIGDSGLFLITDGAFAFEGFFAELNPDTIDMIISDVWLENSDNITILLVRGYTGTEVFGIPDQEGELGVDIDTNDDGVVDNFPWEEVLDAVGVVHEIGGGDWNYGAALGFVDIGPRGAFAPAHIYRSSEDNNWYIGTFGLSEQDNPLDTPGQPNPGTPGPTISTFSPVTGLVGETVVVSGLAFDDITSVTVGETEAMFTVDSRTQITLVIPEGPGGVIAATNSRGTGASEVPFTIESTGELNAVFTEDFEGGTLGQFTQFSRASDKNWIPSERDGNKYAEGNGFQGNEPSDDWLLSSPISLAEIANPALSFVTINNFTGPALQIKVSTDYTSGDPAAANWTSLTANLSAGGFTAADSGIISLSEFAGQTITLAFHYTSEEGAAALWRVDDVKVGNFVSAEAEAKSPWAPIEADLLTFAKNTSQIGGAGIGWINDDNYPIVYSWSFEAASEAANDGWLYILPGSNLFNMVVYSWSLESWIWTTNSFGGWYYNYTNPESGLSGWSNINGN
jgi:hypothetical protein